MGLGRPRFLLQRCLLALEFSGDEKMARLYGVAALRNLLSHRFSGGGLHSSVVFPPNMTSSSPLGRFPLRKLPPLEPSFIP
jgi:hypothetical protein